MKTDLFDFDLPPDRIALRPVSPREAAKLLVVKSGTDFEDRTVGDLPDLLRAGDCLVVNDSKVIAARLKGRRIGRGEVEPSVEATLHKRLDGSHWRAFILGAKKVQVGDVLRFGSEGRVCFLDQLDAEVSHKDEGGEVTLSFSFHGPMLDQAIAERGSMPLHKRLDGSHWRAFILGAKKVQVGDVLRFGSEGRVCFLDQLDAEVSHKDEGGEVTLSFSFHGPMLDQAIAERGSMPLPPYIASRRAPDDQDKTDYQTVFAREDGSVAAPTAGLHFTDGLLARLQERGISVHKVTLHVGAGTFLPVKSDDIEGHKMHAEFGVVTAETAAALNAVRAQGGRIVAVGSTALRTLETAAADDGRIGEFAGDTALFITPGYRFKAVDLMLTNFHLPRSTLFMLVSAFSGLETMQRAYAHAVESDYRFYSYGDACLLYPQR